MTQQTEPTRRAFLKQALALPSAGLLASQASAAPDENEPDRQPNHPDLEELIVALHHARKMAELCLDTAADPEDGSLPDADLPAIVWALDGCMASVEYALKYPVPELEEQRAVWAKRGY